MAHRDRSLCVYIYENAINKAFLKLAWYLLIVSARFKKGEV